MVSGSDDFTLFLWNPSESKKHIARMTGKSSQKEIAKGKFKVKIKIFTHNLTCSKPTIKIREKVWKNVQSQQ